MTRRLRGSKIHKLHTCIHWLWSLNISKPIVFLPLPFDILISVSILDKDILILHPSETLLQMGQRKTPH